MQTTYYTSNSKISEAYNYENSLWMGSIRREVRLSPEKIYANSEKLLDELESQKPYSGTSNHILIKYDAANRPVEYIGVVETEPEGELYPLKITCNYAGDEIRQTYLFQKDNSYLGHVTIYKFINGKIHSSQIFPIDGGGLNEKFGITSAYSYEKDQVTILYSSSNQQFTQDLITLDADFRPLKWSWNDEADIKTWKYDSKGNWVEYRVTHDGKPTQVIRRTFTY